MSTYTVRAKRWKHGWELHVDGVGVTQSRNLDGAEQMVRDYIETLTDHDRPSGPRPPGHASLPGSSAKKGCQVRTSQRSFMSRRNEYPSYSRTPGLQRRDSGWWGCQARLG
jgi:hypothetical protein